MSPTIDLHDRTDLTTQRDTIRRMLLAARPGLVHRLHEGPSGALTIDVPGGRSIEIGRLRRHGRTRWVVVAPRPSEPTTATGPHLGDRHAAGVLITDATSVPGLVRCALRVLDDLAVDVRGAVHPSPSRPGRRPGSGTAHAPATVTA